MSNCVDSTLSLSSCRPETTAKFVSMYAKKQKFLEHLVKFGNDFERASAGLVIDIATAEGAKS